ncbi:UTRA domain-containing protein, partial [Mesorhizobium sp. GbtcB19]|uniref:UTRA domain-containing protein n=1 Tax=Mesorhizobium sp. GbtcB19 TaxID=2824764 RepID=UPI001C2F65B0
VAPGSRQPDRSLPTAYTGAAGALENEEGDPNVRIRRLRPGNNEPIGIQTAQLSAAGVPGFPDAGLLKGSLYEALER